jgi:hypothetical protein
MHAVLRKYKGATALIDEMTERRQDIQSIIADVSGFVSYHAVRTADGLVTVTICQTQAGTEDSTRRAAAWIKENLPSVSLAPPEVTAGEVFLEFTSQRV